MDFQKKRWGAIIKINNNKQIFTKKHYDKIESFYDDISFFYDEKWWYNNPDSRHIKNYINDIFSSNISDGEIVLDIGCGTCDTPIKLALKNCKVIGLDISKNMLSIAIKKISDRGINEILLCKGDAENLPFNENKFDYVISEFTLNYVNYPKKVLKEMLRVLKKDGKIIIIFSNKKPMYIIFWEFLIGNWDFIKKIKKRKETISFPNANAETRFYRYSISDLKNISSDLPILKIKLIGTHCISGFFAYPLLLLGLYINNSKEKKTDFKNADHFIRIKGEKIVYNIFKKGEKLDKYFKSIGRDIIFIGRKI